MATVTLRETVDFDKWLDGTIQDFTVKVAEDELRDAVTKGFDTSPTVVTDGVANRDWHLVKPYGKIEWVSKTSTADAARWIMEELERRSPVLTGRYQRSHIFMINGAQVENEALDHLQQGDVVQIVNIQPYAGKIEGRDPYTRWQTKFSKRPRKGRLSRRGTRKAQGWKASQMQGESSQARNGVYRVVLTAAALRFGKAVTVAYAPVVLSLGVRVWGQLRGSHRGHRKWGWRAQVYPCLTITSKAITL